LEKLFLKLVDLPPWMLKPLVELPLCFLKLFLQLAKLPLWFGEIVYLAVGDVVVAG
jgi:hypothetical protein